ncbi:MAG: TolC family protein [Gemmatimonadetes bacterium]|nr:TolC family protein [Gemmatimonadota bacterium]
MKRSVGRRQLRCRDVASLAAVLTVGSLAAPASVVAQRSVLPDTLDITRAIGIAISESPQLRASRTQADRAGADRLAAWGAFLPTASVRASLDRSSFSRTTFVGEEGLSETLPDVLSSSSQNGSQGLTLNWTVLDGGQRFAAVSQSAANLRAANRRYDDQQRQVVLTVRREFLDALRRQELLELTRLQIVDRERELDIARRRYEIAAVERTDVLGAQSLLLDARIRLLSEENQLRNALRQLVVSMGLPPEASQSLVLAGDEGMPEGMPNLDHLVRTAITSDPELAALEADRAAASSALWSARMSYLPRIDATLFWGRGENFGPGDSFWQFDLGDTRQTFSVSASWSLFNGFGREQQNAQASAARRQAEEDLRRRRLEIERDVRRYGADIGELAQTLDLLDQAYSISRERLDMEQERYRLGTGSFLELQSAVDAVQRAETSLIQRRYEYLTAWSNLAEYLDSGPGN